MSLLDVRNLTVDLPTAAGWIRPVNDISFQLDPAESLGRAIGIRKGCWQRRRRSKKGS